MRRAMHDAERAFAAAVKRRDKICRIRDYSPCSGRLECSHFHTRGASQALMFYPYNAFAQCAEHHRQHHCSKNGGFYGEWLEDRFPDEAEWMRRHRADFVKYTDENLAEIARLCEANDLDGLCCYIRGLLDG